MWELKDGDKEFTVVKIIIEGVKDNKKIRYTYNMLDRHNEKSNTHSMARTTGYTATTVLRLLGKGMFNQKGICPPEYIGQKPECVNFILNELKARGVIYNQVIENLGR
jgi:saccharopine dehydrogenase-like NADP-dependent oxidoreductase